MDGIEHIQAAWEISNAMAKLNDLIWDLYEYDFIELFINRNRNTVEEMAYEVYQEEPRF